MEARPEHRPKPQHAPAYRRLAQRLRELRVEAGLTQRGLADQIRLPASTVHKIEHGDRRIDPVEFVRWCRVCGVDAGQTLNQLKLK